MILHLNEFKCGFWLYTLRCSLVKILTGINVAEVSLVLDIVHKCVFGVELA